MRIDIIVRSDHHAGVVLGCIHQIGAGLALKLKKPRSLHSSLPERQAFPLSITVQTSICAKLTKHFLTINLVRVADLFLRSNSHFITLKYLIKGNKLLDFLQDLDEGALLIVGELLHLAKEQFGKVSGRTMFLCNEDKLVDELLLS